MSKHSLTRGLLIAAGITALIFAFAVPGESYSAFLLGANAKDLSWGPTLFRVLLALHGAVLVFVGLALRQRKTEPVVENEFGPAAAERPTTGRAWVILIVLGTAALALRLWSLNSDLWIDEVFTLLDFVRQPMGQILTSFPSQNQHMLFSILAHASTSVFGESAWSLRLPSVIFGVGSILAFFFLCKRLLSEREALLGAALMTVSYHHIWFSQNARGYMGLLLFTLTATWCWMECLSKSEWRWWAGYVISVVLGMWIHPTMAFVVASHGSVFLAFLIFPRLGGVRHPDRSPERRELAKAFVSWALCVTLTLQLYALALPEFLAVGLHEESPKDSEWTNPLWVVTESIRGLSIGFGGAAIVAFGAAFVAFGWLRLFRRHPRTSINMVLPAILAGGTMLALGHNLWPRFFFFSMGFGLLIVIHGAMELPRAASGFVTMLRDRHRITASAGVTFAGILIVASLITVPRNYALPKQDFSGAKEFVESQRQPEDAAVAVSLAGIVYGDYLTPHWQVVKTAGELERLDLEERRVWLVYTLPIEVRSARPDLWKVIERDYEVVKVFPGTLSGGDVFVCQKRREL